MLKRLASHCSSGRVILFLAALASSSACSEASSVDRFEANEEQIRVVQTIPLAGTTEVEPDVRIDLCWSDLVDPRSVSDLDATISSGSTVVDTDLQVQLVPWRGPGGVEPPPTTESPWCSGSVLSITPQADLAQSVLHRLRLRPNLVGWEGQSIDTDTPGWLEEDDATTAYLLEFSVGVAEDDAEPDDAPDAVGPTLTELFEPGAVFDPQRELCSCHTGGDPDAQALLDLTDAATAYQSLVVPSRIRDTGFPMVTARRPSESFLLHKLMRNPDGTALFGVLGEPMPQDTSAIEYLDLVAVARWIEAGAVL